MAKTRRVRACANAVNRRVATDVHVDTRTFMCMNRIRPHGTCAHSGMCAVHRRSGLAFVAITRGRWSTHACHHDVLMRCSASSAQRQCHPAGRTRCTRSCACSHEDSGRWPSAEPAAEEPSKESSVGKLGDLGGVFFACVFLVRTGEG